MFGLIELFLFLCVVYYVFGKRYSSSYARRQETVSQCRSSLGDDAMIWWKSINWVSIAVTADTNSGDWLWMFVGKWDSRVYYWMHDDAYSYSTRIRIIWLIEVGVWNCRGCVMHLGQCTAIEPFKYRACVRVVVVVGWLTTTRCTIAA